MTDTWLVFAIVAAVALVGDFLTPQLRRRARRLPDATPGRGQDRFHAHE